MKIPLIIENERISLTAFIRNKNHRINGPVKFVVDTGCPLTNIGYSDIRRLNASIPRTNCKEPVFLGGVKVNFAELRGDTSITVKTSENQAKIFSIPKLMAARNIYSKDGKSYAPPSLLGIDFLKKT